VPTIQQALRVVIPAATSSHTVCRFLRCAGHFPRRTSLIVSISRSRSAKQALEAGVLALELPQALDFGGTHIAVAALPPVERLLLRCRGSGRCHER
jgi:hypothetical protein